MRIEALWREMEEEAAHRDEARWLTRFALPEPGRVLLVALETGTGTRALLLPLPKTDIPRKREWPDSEGLEVFGLSLEGQSHLGVRLKARSYADVFCVLAEDVARHIAHAPDSHTAASAMLARIGRWRKFLAAAASGLSTERIRGLVGELTFLRHHLLGSTDPAKALACWRAPLRAHQDFQAMGSAIEVKATTAKQPQLIRITSERQLDDTGLSFLYLYVAILDERIADSDQPSVGESLPYIVADIRRRLHDAPEAAELFEDRLLDAGFLEADVPRYSDRFFTLRGERAFRVDEGFPRLLETLLPLGVGDVSYSLSLPACAPFAVEIDSMVRTFTGAATADRATGGPVDA